MYLKKEEMFNITYSIDMIRLKTYISFTTFSEIEFRFKTCWSDYVEKSYTTGRIDQFFYNYSVEVGEGQSFWFGFLHNTEKRDLNAKTEYNFTIEFNPNKLKDNDVLMYLLNISGKWYLKSLDLACDLPVGIFDIVFDKGRKRNLKVESHSFYDRTIYLGTGDKRVKIYNKKIEAGLKIEGELTRIEISKNFDDFEIRKIKFFNFSAEIFPTLYLNKYIYSLKDYEDKTLLAVLYAVQNDFEINLLSRRYKEKIKKLLEGGTQIKFRPNPATDVLRQVIYFYFVRNNKMIFV